MNTNETIDDCALQAARSAQKAAQAAQIAQEAARLAQGSHRLCLVQIRIAAKRLRYSQHYASESQALEAAHNRFARYAKAGETLSITAHAAGRHG